MKVFYQCLDIIATMIEALFYYIIADKFHLTPENKIHKYLQIVIQCVIVYVLTWFTKLGEYKTVILTCLLSIELCVLYRVSFHKAAIWAMLGMVNIILEESLGTIIAYAFKIPLSDMIENQLFLSWQIYVIVILCRFGGIAAICVLFKNYHYQFTWKDFLVVLFNYIIVEIFLCSIILHFIAERVIFLIL